MKYLENTQKRSWKVPQPSETLKYLEMFAEILPTALYWESEDNVILGANNLALKALGISREAFVKKNIYDIYSPEVAEHIKKHNKMVIEKDKILSQEEIIKIISTGETKCFNFIKAPLRDENSHIIGIINTLIDITAEKENVDLKKRAKILQYLEIAASSVPAPIYWLDLNSMVLGGNEALFMGTGALSGKDFIGKTARDLYPREMADPIIAHNEEVMRTGKTMSQEEVIKDISTGEAKYFTAIKAPLRDDEGHIIGLVGTSIDITLQKESERLKFENENNKNLIAEQEKFMHLANQVAHDIRSPLASLLMIVKSCDEIPEEDRIALREAAIGIGDIANHLLNQYEKNEADLETEERQPILVSATLIQLLTDKKYQYQNLSFKFDSQFTAKSHFAFIKIEPTAFKRMISNLINNAVEACDHKLGKITLKLDSDKQYTQIIIQDNGKGMPPEVVDKIMSNVAITSGKQSGHGIGLTQVRDTLHKNQGELSINSLPGQGTRMTLTFPRIKTPSWIAEEIILGQQDIIVILDDDNSIHGAWDAHFDSILKEAPNIQLKHFIVGQKALNFMDDLSPPEKNRILLLTDYELLKQELNGLHVISKSKIQRSVLVTSHYAHQLIRDQAAKTGTKILPKQLASEIPIKIDPAFQYGSAEKSLKKVDLVIVDDDEQFVNSLTLFVFSDRTVDKYHDPYYFLKNVAQYSKDTPIYLDNNFSSADLTGLAIAKQLYEQGYSRLYILSGEVFKEQHIPAYVTVIKKDDIDKIQNSIQS